MSEIAIPKIFMQIAVLVALFFISFCVFEIYMHTTREDIYAIEYIADEVNSIHASLLAHFEAAKPSSFTPQSHGSRNCVFPRFEQSGGYIGPGSADSGFSRKDDADPAPSLSTVARALSMNDRALVALKGTISQSLGGGEYMFADSSGTIEVHIGPKEWVGQQVSASDTVKIYGCIHKDRKRFSNHIYVKRLIKQ